MKEISIRILEVRKLLDQFEISYYEDILAICSEIHECFKGGHKLLICGNGGSAADSQHFAAEFMNSFSKEVIRLGLPAIALSTDTSFLTAHSNDYSFDTVFSRQVEALGKEKDVLIAISTSGSSKNCIQALQAGKKLGLRTIAFTRKGGLMVQEADRALQIQSNNTQHIQELHLISYHIIVEVVEKLLFPKST